MQPERRGDDHVERDRDRGRDDRVVDAQQVEAGEHRAGRAAGEVGHVEQADRFRVAARRDCQRAIAGSVAPINIVGGVSTRKHTIARSVTAPAPGSASVR